MPECWCRQPEHKKPLKIWKQWKVAGSLKSKYLCTKHFRLLRIVAEQDENLDEVKRRKVVIDETKDNEGLQIQMIDQSSEELISIDIDYPIQNDNNNNERCCNDQSTNIEESNHNFINIDTECHKQREVFDQLTTWI